MSQLECSTALTNTQWWRHHLTMLASSSMSPLATIFGYSSHPSPGNVLFEQLLKDIFLDNEFVTSSRRHIKDIFYKMYLRHLQDITQKTSFLRCIWDVSKTSRKRRLSGDVLKTSYICLEKDIFPDIHVRCLKHVSRKTSFFRCLWEVFETSLSMETWLKCVRDLPCWLEKTIMYC